MSGRVVSVGTMIKQLDGLTDADTTEWERRFIWNIIDRTRNGTSTSDLTEKQVETIHSIWERHFV